jgi:glycine/D-amino acid oxidase-like deaminating enzyme
MAFTEQHAENSYIPVLNPTTPYWRTELHPLDSHRSTEQLPAQCDVLIIGAGMSGVSFAYHLCEATGATKPSIVLLEARQVCSGATGRNGGHVKVKTQSALSIAKDDDERATKSNILTSFVEAHIDALQEVVEREDLDCEFELRRSYDVFTNTEDAEVFRQAWADHRKQGAEWTRGRQLLDPKMAEAVTGVKDVKIAFSSPACSMWPYKFVTQLLARTMERKGCVIDDPSLY